jgi:glycosyltransferase involved in cell wall biosynthesis
MSNDIYIGATPKTSDRYEGSEALLTIVVPSLNQHRYIADCLREPLGLVSQGVELLVMDGGSTDRTLDVLQELLGPGESWVSEKDGGQSHAINKGFKRARGKWLAFQNSDDFYFKGGLELVLSTIENDEECDVIMGGVAFVNERGDVKRTSYAKPIFFPCLSQINFINNQSFFVRRNLISEVGLLDEDLQFCLDYDWFVRIFRAKPRVHYLREIIGAQRLHAATKTSMSQDVCIREFSSVCRKHFTYVERALGRICLYPYRLFRLLYGHRVYLDKKRFV